MEQIEIERCKNCKKPRLEHVNWVGVIPMPGTNVLYCRGKIGPGAENIVAYQPMSPLELCAWIEDEYEQHDQA